MANALDTVSATEEQAGSKVLTLQTAIDQVANAVNARANISVLVANVVLTAENIFRNGILNITGATVAGRTVTWPIEVRSMIVIVSPLNTETVQLIRGTASFSLASGAAYLVDSDGTANGLMVRFLTEATASPIDIGFLALGVPDPATLLSRFLTTRQVTIPVGMANSQAYARVAPSGAVAFDVRKNGVSVGSVNFASGSNTATFTMAAQTVLAPGDRLEIFSPAAALGIEDVSITITGTR